jgi:hypothetical protein
MKYFVTFSTNYADEFDLWSAALMDEEEFDNYYEWLGYLRDTMVQNDTPFEFYFGTNEFILFNYFEEIERALYVKAINNDVAEMMERVMFMHTNELPNFPNSAYIADWLNEHGFKFDYE